MLPTITLRVLLLVACLPAVFGQDYYWRWRNEAHGCQYESLSRYKYVYFKEPSKPQHTLSIKTEWYNYATDLRLLVLSQGFELARAPNQNEKSQYCGWTDLKDVWKDAVHRGTITFKDLSPPAGNGSLLHNDVTRRAASIVINRPSDATIEKVARILRENYPYRDIFELVEVCMLPFVGVCRGLALLRSVRLTRCWGLLCH
jgi:hypothetical protein